MSYKKFFELLKIIDPDIPLRLRFAIDNDETNGQNDDELGGENWKPDRSRYN